MDQIPFKFILLILVLTSLSCETDASKTESVDIEEFLPKSKKEYNYEEDTIQQVTENPPDSLELLIESLIPNAEFRSASEQNNNKHFPDRLDYTQRFYHELSIDSILYELVVWEFEDSIHTINAFYNWIDCFGKKCKSIRIGDSQWIYDGSFQLLVDDTKLIYVASKEKMDRKLWEGFFEPISKETWNYHMYQPLKRKVKWFNLASE